MGLYIAIVRKHGLFILLLAVCMFVYWKGLSGPFLFDDFANLSALGDYGLIDSWERLRLYLSNGIAGPTGRPITLLTFLIDARDWPASPWSFKFTNLLLHLLNALLLYKILLITTRLLRYEEKKVFLISVVAAGIWLLHPFFISTILYPVQRMAILPATFTLIAFLFYLDGRKHIEKDPKRTFINFSIAIGLCTLLATFSKENGILLPLLLSLFEFFVLSHSTLPKLNKKFSIPFLALPSILIILAFSYKIPDFIKGYQNRDFTAYERLLTQFRVLSDYLYQLIIPHATTNGLYTDSFTKSTGILQPTSTLVSIIFISLIIVIAWLIRKRQPLISFSLFLFFTAHLVESSIIPLELYFEHRNYLPSLFLFLPIAIALTHLKVKQNFIIIPIFLIFGTLSFFRASLWSNEEQMMTVWAERNPKSIRAQRTAILVMKNNNNLKQADIILERALSTYPKNHALLIDKLLLDCQLDRDARKSFKKLNLQLLETPLDYHYMPYIGAVLTQKTLPQCNGLSKQTLPTLFSTINKNSAVIASKGLQRQIKHFKGLYFIQHEDFDKALEAFLHSLELMPDVSTGMHQISLLAEKKAFQQALTLLNYVDKLPLFSTNSKGIDFTEEIKRIRIILVEDIRNG